MDVKVEVELHQDIEKRLLVAAYRRRARQDASSVVMQSVTNAQKRTTRVTRRATNDEVARVACNDGPRVHDGDRVRAKREGSEEEREEGEEPGGVHLVDDDWVRLGREDI